MGKIAISVEFEVKPEHWDDFLAIMRGHAAKTRETEEGCERFDVMVPKNGDKRVILFELYRDDAAFDVHRKSPRLAEVQASYKDMVAGRKLTLCDHVG
jgi:(4S)-4-hydroxy-5-phosphonooxypentane-2,3-dione isomerase